jgi:hypothetical protein
MSALLQVAARFPGVALPVLVGTAAPTKIMGGIPYDSGVLAIDTTNAIARHHQGLPFTANGRLAASDLDPVDFNSGAEPLDTNGRLAMSNDSITSWSSGIPYVSTGGIAADGLDTFLGVRITVQPTSQSVQEDGSAVFTLTATSGNASPMTYQWQQFIGAVWTNLSNGVPVSGVTTNTLTINPAPLAYNGEQYRCLISNSVDTNRASNTVLLTVISLVTFNVLTEAGEKMITETSDYIVTQAA